MTPSPFAQGGPQHAAAPPDRAALEALLEPFGQQHVLAFWDALGPEERIQLAAQIQSIDLARVDRLFHGKHETHDWPALALRAVGPPAVRLSGEGQLFSPAEACQRGEQALRAGRVGVALVAGGQGTRLGFEHPKGMYPVGPVSNASLFQILIEKVIAAGRRYGVRVPLYLMTSSATHQETIDFLQAYANFGLAAEDLQIFCQGAMPAVDAQSGKLLLAGPAELCLSPDGHGGMLSALRASGILNDLRRRGIEQLFYMQVDNPLATVCDTEFIGAHLLSGSELSTQVVAKRTPTDRMGNVVSIDDRVQIIEYSDLPEAAARQRLPDGSLKLWAGSIAVHVFDVDLVERMSGDDEHSLPFHQALKKVPYLDAGGRKVEPDAPNAVKFEQFIFDLLPSARHSIVVEVDEARCFAPLKNEPGAERDSPQSVQAQMIALHAEWLRQAGTELLDGVPVEISPLFALDAAEAASKVKPGLRITEPTYFRD
jgi:UDP-N-acetylglucosamine/UDP-N-acetylgalactosamine diphosphorylase